MTFRSFLWALGLCAAIAATNRYEGRPHPDFIPGDSYAYFMLAEAAPGLPQEELSFHHAQRIVIPYVLGMVGHVVPIPIHRLFQILAVLMTVTILTMVGVILNDLSIPRPQALLVSAILAFNPWAFRPYLTFPEMVNDLGFVLGLAILFRGLVRGQAAPVLLGQLLASVSRQTGLLLIPAVGLWLWRDRQRWGNVAPWRRATLWLGTAALGAFVYAATANLADRIAGINENMMHLVGLWIWLATKFDAWELLVFALKALISPLIPLALLLALSGRKRSGADSRIVPVLLFASACIWTQPLLTGPELDLRTRPETLIGGNGPRLVTIGLLPLCLALAVRLRDAGVFAHAGGQQRLWVLIVLLALASLHHWYALAAMPSLTQMILFATMYALAFVGCLALTTLELRDSRPRRSAAKAGVA